MLRASRCLLAFPPTQTQTEALEGARERVKSLERAVQQAEDRNEAITRDREALRAAKSEAEAGKVAAQGERDALQRAYKELQARFENAEKERDANAENLRGVMKRTYEIEVGSLMSCLHARRPVCTVVSHLNGKAEILSKVQ